MTVAFHKTHSSDKLLATECAFLQCECEKHALFYSNSVPDDPMEAFKEQKRVGICT